MTVAEKLTTIAENQQRVYDAGYAKGQAEGGGGSYDEGYEAGQQAEYDRFWDAYQQNGNRTNYENAFCGLGWTDETFKPKYDIVENNLILYMPFRKCGIVDLGEAIRKSGKSFTTTAVRMQYTFQNCPYLEVVDGINFMNPLIQIIGAFDGCSKLRKIQTLPISENATQLYFDNVPALEEISFSGVIPVNITFTKSSKLNADSVQSIIDHLKDLTGQAAQSLVFHTDVINNMTEEQALAIWSKNWTLD